MPHDTDERFAIDESKPFDTDGFGQTKITRAWVCFYQVGSEWEVDIIAPDDSVVGFDVPLSALRGRGELARHLGARIIPEELSPHSGF